MVVKKVVLLLVLIPLFTFGFTVDYFSDAEAANELRVSYGGTGSYEIDDYEAEQISTTDLGNLDVLLAPSPSVPQPKQFLSLHIFILKPDTRNLINHIDYKVIISKDGDEVYSTRGSVHTHSGQGTVSYKFSTAGIYQVKVSVLGVDFEDIPVESALFSLNVGNVKEEQAPEATKPPKIPEATEQTKNSDTDFTASTFVDRYQDLLQKGGARVSVLIKVAGDVESTDPAKRAK